MESMLLAWRSARALSDMEEKPRRWSLVGNASRWREPLEYRDILLLLIEEAGVIGITRQCANIGAAENAVPVASYRVVGEITEEFGKELQKGCGCAPRGSELLENEKNRVRAGEQRFVGQFIVKD